jgi:hypothetical protein
MKRNHSTYILESVSRTLPSSKRTLLESYSDEEESLNAADVSFLMGGDVCNLDFDKYDSDNNRHSPTELTLDDSSTQNFIDGYGCDIEALIDKEIDRGKGRKKATRRDLEEGDSPEGKVNHVRGIFRYRSDPQASVGPRLTAS